MALLDIDSRPKAGPFGMAGAGQTANRNLLIKVRDGRTFGHGMDYNVGKK